MAQKFVMPKLGATMEEGRIIKWLVKAGDKVEKDTPLLEIESDKVNLEVEALFEGTVLKLLSREDDVVPILQTIAIIGTPGEDLSSLLDTETTGGVEALARETAQPKQVIPKEETSPSPETLWKVTPAAKNLAARHQIDLAKIKPNPNGIITGKEVEAYLDELKTKAAGAAAEATPEQAVIDSFEPQKLKGMRATIARRLLKAWQTIPMAENMVEADVSATLKFCEELTNEYSGAGIKITITDVLIKAIAAAIKLNPHVNAYLDEETIVYKKDINVGLAVALDHGLVVPVIKNADRKGFLQINTEKKNLALKAREGRLEPDEMHGSSITLSNLGAYGVDVIKPIINMPDLCIVGVGKVTKKPVVINDGIAIRSMMWISLVFDHRILDGAPAAKFVVDIKKILEDPTTLKGENGNV